MSMLYYPDKKITPIKKSKRGESSNYANLHGSRSKDIMYIN